jgi:hypothetical protein
MATEKELFAFYAINDRIYYHKEDIDCKLKY